MLSLHVVPELRLSEDRVLGEDSHSVELGLGISLAGQTSSDHEKLSDLGKGSAKLLSSVPWIALTQRLLL